jgi:hypothetical protein
VPRKNGNKAMKEKKGMHGKMMMPEKDMKNGMKKKPKC